MNVAVIIAAHLARYEWLGACLSSIVTSGDRLQSTDRVVPVVGVDGCAETADVLDRLNVPKYWWSPVNVGPYVMRNSLIEQVPADAYVIFDADDVMLPEYFPLVLDRLRTAILVGPSRIECDENLRHVKSATYHHGVCAFRSELLDVLGGFGEERLAADVDFIARAAMAARPVQIIQEPCYLRRRHPASLTKHAETGIGTAARNAAARRMERLRMSGAIYAKPATVPLEHRTNSGRSHRLAACVRCGMEMVPFGEVCWQCRAMDSNVVSA